MSVPDGGGCALALNVAVLSRVVASEPTVEGIVSAMLELHPDRDNPRVVWHSAREAVKKRPEA